MTHEKQNAILRFWFGDDSLQPLINRDLWFKPNPEFDRQVRENFSEMLAQASTGAYDDWAKTPMGALALVILLDQFPRQIYRNDPQAFAQDQRARRIAETAIERGLDHQLSGVERCFLYLPLEHTEDLAAQERAVELFSDLIRVATPEERSMISEALNYAVRHRDVIATFGRFPHRNDVLGRESTREEREFLKRPDSRF